MLSISKQSARGLVVAVILGGLVGGCAYPGQYHKVLITSNPRGARVQVDGKFAGNTPTTYLAQSGYIGWRKYVILATKGDYQETSRVLEEGLTGLFPSEVHLVLEPTAASRTPEAIVRPPSPPAIRNLHVLIIGVGEHADRAIPGLEYAQADAKLVYEFFRDSDWSRAKKTNVHLLTSKANAQGLAATKSGIAKAIERYLKRRAVNQDDLVIIYFSGHGDQDDDGVYHWVTADSERGVLSSGFPETELNRLIAQIPARHRLIISDACHAGALSGRKNLKLRGLSGTDSILFSSCRGRETSVEWKEKGHGVFTWALVEGLRGSADSACGDGDERVTLGELKKYLEQRVPKYARKAGGRQTPVVRIPQGWDGVYLTR